MMESSITEEHAPTFHQRRFAQEQLHKPKPKAQRSTLAKQAQPAPAAKPKRVIAQA